jgi:hypothetical protein
VVEQRAYPTLRAVTVPKRGVMQTIAPEHGFWNGQTRVSGVPGDDLVSVRFLERPQQEHMQRKTMRLFPVLNNLFIE